MAGDMVVQLLSAIRDDYVSTDKLIKLSFDSNLKEYGDQITSMIRKRLTREA